MILSFSGRADNNNTLPGFGFREDYVMENRAVLQLQLIPEATNPGGSQPCFAVIALLS
jgi:hypothetical protein